MRTTKQPQERRAELIAAARTLFDKKGVTKTRVSDIVKEVGVAQGVFYYYFSSKDEMVQQVVDIVGLEVSSKANDILQEDIPYGQKMAKFIELFLDLLDKFLGDDESSLNSLHLIESTQGEGQGNITLQVMPSFIDCFHSLVLQGVEQKEITASHPWDSAQVVLYGLLEYGRICLPPRHMIYSVTEQSLGMSKGSLVKYVKRKNTERKREHADERV